jgi:hypothetical protein
MSTMVNGAGAAGTYATSRSLRARADLRAGPLVESVQGALLTSDSELLQPLEHDLGDLTLVGVDVGA